VTEQEVYAGRVVTLRLKYLTLADGRVALREIVEHAGGAAVVAVDDDDNVLLVRQHRPAVGADLLELPAGLVDPGESPLETARRELEEETGFRAASVEPLISFYSSPGFCTELLHVFVARGLVPSGAGHDADEIAEVLRIPLEQAIERVTRGEISDAKTVTGLLAYWRTQHQ
jgi:ADP-ribose pyrophosphatase